MPQKKGNPEGLRTQLFSRGLSLARASLSAGKIAATRFLNSDAAANSQWLSTIETLVNELGQLKGSAMKVGQTLSLYGETLFPKEVNEILKSLQHKAPPLAWSAMEPVLQRELGPERLSELDIDQASFAAASIGQVYRGRIRSTGQKVAIKIQYPGVDEAVETDMKLLKVLMGLPGLFPGGLKLDSILAEVKEMFAQELDYSNEMRYAEIFRAAVEGDERYVIPRTFERFCTPRVLTMEFIEGHRADSSEVLGLSLERRNRLGAAYFELYLKELLQIRQVQTDPHLGNYLIQIDESGNDRLVLFDFGAVREVPETFLNSYQQLMHGSLYQDARYIERGGRGLGLLQPDDSLQLVKDYVDLCLLLTEPFASTEPYNWGTSDLPKRVANKVGHVAFNYKLRAPPRELVFLDRKLGGVFIFLSGLKCQWAGRETVIAALEKYRNFKG